MEKQTSVIKVLESGYPRLRAPDLDVMEQFLLEFGMVRAARTPDALYMRGTGPLHHIHITEKGNPSFVSAAYVARSEEDLQRLAKVPGATGVHTLDEPGGGKRVLLVEPTNGFRIEVVHGIQKVPELQVEYRHPNWSPEVMRTIGDPKRMRFGPAHVQRLSHAVFSTPELPKTLAWFRETLGLIRTDEFYIGSRDNLVGSFNRVDRGADPVDHHALNCYHNPRAGFQHASFVVQDLEDLLIGHMNLTRVAKYQHMRGVGYHAPGGQVFDYWLSPWGQMHELYYPIQRFTSETPSNVMPAPAAHDPTSAFANNITEIAD